MPRLFTVIAQHLPTCALLTVALGALSVSIVVSNATTCARVFGVAICIAMYCAKVHGCWAAVGCFPVCPNYVHCQKICPLERLGVSY